MTSDIGEKKYRKIDDDGDWVFYQRRSSNKRGAKDCCVFQGYKR